MSRRFKQDNGVKKKRGLGVGGKGVRGGFFSRSAKIIKFRHVNIIGVRSCCEVLCC